MLNLNKSKMIIDIVLEQEEKNINKNSVNEAFGLFKQKTESELKEIMLNKCLLLMKMKNDERTFKRYEMDLKRCLNKPNISNINKLKCYKNFAEMFEDEKTMVIYSYCGLTNYPCINKVADITSKFNSAYKKLIKQLKS